MAQKRGAQDDRSLEELKTEATALRLQGIRATQISEILDSGHSAWTINWWFRESKQIPKTKTEVLKLHCENKSARDIAKILNLTSDHVRRIIRSEKRKKKSKRRR